MTDAPDFLRAGESARLFGVSLRTVRRWIAEEVLPSVKLGGARLADRLQPALNIEKALLPHDPLRSIRPLPRMVIESDS
jgi:excisionase family DNA binding protein